MYANVLCFYCTDNTKKKKKVDSEFSILKLSDMFHLVVKRNCFCMAWWNCKHPCVIISKKHPVLNKIVLWRKLHAGKQQHSPHMGLLFLLAAFISSPEPVFHKDHEEHVVQLVSLWIRNISCYGESWERLLIQCPWTSLAGVLIKSLLAIPWRSLVRVFPCHIPPPRPSFVPSVSLFLVVAFELPSVSSPTSKLW